MTLLPITIQRRIAVAALGIQIDVNQASVDWLRLPGLSIHQARVELCRSGVQFYCLEDIAAALNATAATKAAGAGSQILLLRGFVLKR